MVEKRRGLSIYEVRCCLKGIGPIGKIKICIMKKCKAHFNEVAVTTFRDTILLRGVGSSGIVSYAMK